MKCATLDFLTIVSGLPRSGTSMMMRMLESGGMPALCDGIRTPDEDNPNGYYELECAKRTREDPSWLEDTDGKAVKMVYRLLYDLPTDRAYRVLFMTRELDEVLASQRVMLNRHGVDQAAGDEERMAALFRADLQRFREWVKNQAHIQLIDVNYNAILGDPGIEVRRINRFLGDALDEIAMVGVVDGTLYRNRSVVPR